MRTVTDDERRRRLGLRHALTPGAGAADPESAARAVVALHATEIASIYLSLWARVPGLSVADIDRALYVDRTLVKQMAMRSTLFVFPRDLLPAAWGSASARVASPLAARLVKEVEREGLAPDGAAWLAAAREAVLAALADGARELSARQLRELLPELRGSLHLAPGTRYGGEFPVAPRVLVLLAVEGHLVRGRNDGHWRTSRPLWASMSQWLREDPVPLEPRQGYAELVRRWLGRFGPGTREDIRWWLGATVATVDRALADLGAVTVALEDGRPAWLLADDLDEPGPVEPWAALLPVLDPTVMGWRERGFFLGEHGSAIFDRNGNAGTTAWWEGRAVGCWVQDPDGVVILEPLEELPAEGRAALEREATRLTTWLAGDRVGTVYASPAMKSARQRPGATP